VNAAITYNITNMNTKGHFSYLNMALMVSALITLPLTMRAGQHPRYKLIDLGTFGGPGSGVEGTSKILNNQGTLVGGADTSSPDPFSPNCFWDCFVGHAFQWQKGVLTDLGALAGGGSSFAIWINDHGQTVGISQNGVIDPLTGAPQTLAVLWQNGELISLGTFGGTSQANAINNRGQVIGVAANTVPDPFSLAGFVTQTRAFLWENGLMRDLGTLGGPDSFAQIINERGQVAGFSYTDSTPNDTTGAPTVHAFLWEDGQMQDLGSLGGTHAEVANLNNRGQVTGFMNLPGDESRHPFLWERGTLQDLGTFGGSNGGASWLNDSGDVVGNADLPGDQLHDAFLWRNGVMTDLGNLGVTSGAASINSKGQIVGASRISRVPSQVSAFLWENGGPMVDLNTLVPADSALHMVYADYINDRGEIAGTGVPPGISVQDFLDNESLGHAFLLIPEN